MTINLTSDLFIYYNAYHSDWGIQETDQDSIHAGHRARKSRTTLQNKVRLKVLPEQLALFVNTSVTFKKCIIQ